MKLARAAQDSDDPEGRWRNTSGAPTKADLIRAYAAEHPDASHSAIARALGVSRPTVIKWLKPGTQPEQSKPTSKDAAFSLETALRDRYELAKAHAMAGEIEGGQIDLGAIADLLTKRR